MYFCKSKNSYSYNINTQHYIQIHKLVIDADETSKLQNPKTSKPIGIILTLNIYI